MRTYQYCRVGDFAANSDEPGSQAVVCEEDEANCMISLQEDGTHVPMIDLDFEARLVPSSTPGHFHLILDGITLTPEKYETLLQALRNAGILEPGNVNRYYRNGYSVLRLPGVMKEVAT